MVQLSGRQLPQLEQTVNNLGLHLSRIGLWPKAIDFWGDIPRTLSTLDLSNHTPNDTQSDSNASVPCD